MTFETIGYYLEFIVDGKFIGTKNIDKRDRDRFGYYGTKTEIAKTDIILSNKRKIKAGQEFKSRLYPLNGKKNV